MLPITTDRLKKLKVRDSLFLVGDEFYKRDSTSFNTYDVVVSKITRKYITVNIPNLNTEKVFRLETGKLKSIYPSSFTLYENEQDWKDDMEADNLHSLIKGLFNSYQKRGNLNYTLEQYRKVVEILNIKVN